MLLVIVPWFSSGLVAQPTKTRNTVFRQPLLLASDHNDGDNDSRSSYLGLQLSPLIGGPDWLTIHVKVVLETRNGEQHKWDFVPSRPSDPDTLRRLLLLQQVPGDIRYFAPPPPPSKGPQKTSNDELTRLEISRNKETGLVIRHAQTFCEEYPNSLHLVSNNCATFAYQLYRVIYQASNTP